jgi:hypothetical protein
VRLSADKEGRWPYLFSEGYQVASQPTWDYNCIAFAAGCESEWWWPDANGDAAWPDKVNREEQLACFAEAFATIGYQVCEHSDLEPGYEKIAIYARNGIPTHAARQLPDGRWKSKLGAWEDIEHNTLKAVEGDIYGQAVLFMKRRAT